MSQLTPEELQSVKDLQSKYNQTVFEIGVAETQILTFERQIAKLRDDKTSLVKDLETIEQKEAALVATLQTVYGNGAINPEPTCPGSLCTNSGTSLATNCGQGPLAWGGCHNLWSGQVIKLTWPRPGQAIK